MKSKKNSFQKKIYISVLFILFISAILSCNSPIGDAFQQRTEPAAAPNISGPEITNNPQPTWNWTMDDGIDQVRYKLNEDGTHTYKNGPITTFTPLQPLPDGTYNLYVEVLNKSDEWSRPGAFTTIIDTVAPSQPVFDTAIITLTNDTTPTWNWTVPSAAVEIRYQLDGQDSGSWQLYTGTDLTSYTPDTPLTDGSHTLYVQIKNWIESWSLSASSTIVVDTTPPSITGLSDLSGTVSEYTWNWASSDTEAEYRYAISESVNPPVDFDAAVWGSTTSASFDAAAEDVTGRYYIHVQARDTLGNEASITSVYADFDPEPPAPPVVSGTSPNGSTQPTWNWNEPAETVNFRYQLNGESENRGCLRYFLHTRSSSA
jgi:hypothetical protein